MRWICHWTYKNLNIGAYHNFLFAKVCCSPVYYDLVRMQNKVERQIRYGNINGW